MCTYLTEQIEVAGSGKGPGGWFPVTNANVHLDHRVHAQFEHTVNIDLVNDLRNPGRGPGARVALELTEEAAVELAEAIATALAAAPPGLASAAATKRAHSSG